MVLTVGSLFSGIGGIDLGLERAGMESRWFVEWDAHCQNVLRRHWPGLPVYGDITTVDWSTVERVDVLAGGFPCQPISNAGKRLGTDDDRWLWPEFARAIRVLEPRYILVENVAALLGRGFEHVITDLAALGYDAEWDCIPAAAVGAPHLRDRLWTVAYSSRPRRRQVAGGASGNEGSDAGGSAQDNHQSRRDGARRAVADANAARRRVAGEGDTRSPRVSGRDTARRGGNALAHAYRQRGFLPTRWIFTAEQESGGYRPAGRLADGEWWSAEPDVGRVAHGIPHRVDRLRSLGNAVVPQVVEWIGRAIVAFDEGEAVSDAA